MRLFVPLVCLVRICGTPTFFRAIALRSTPDYMAPEAIDNRGAGRGEPTDTRVSYMDEPQPLRKCTPPPPSPTKSHFQADLWSVGCMLYQTMAGLPPFRSAGAYATFQKVLRHAALSARAMTRSIAAGGSESRTDPLGRLCLDDGSIDIDGLLYPAIFAPPARALVDALLCDAATRLGCDGAAGAVVAGCDRELTQSARPEMPMSATPVPVSAPPVDGAAGASTKLSPHAEVSDSTSVLKPRIPASLHKARRALKATPTSFPESTPASIPERGTSRALPPASATVPLLLPFVDHGALLRHAFLASECRARDADTDLSGWSSVTEECTLLEIGTAALRGAATGDEPLLLCALNLLSMRVASLKPVPLACLLIPKCSSLSSPTASPDSPISEWHAAAAVVRSLDWSSTLELMHMVALRRRIHVPHISALFSPGDPALARCVRWVGLPNRRSTGIAQELFRCGELGPREAQGWNLSLSAYCFPADEPLRRAWVPAMLRDRAIEPGEAVNDMGWRVVSAQDYHSLNYLVVVPNASALLDGAAAGTCDALDPLVAAINALSPAPRAILFTGRLFPAAGTDDLDDARRADRLRSMLSRFSATLRNESTSVILATEDRVWASAALLGSGADASRDDSAFRLRLETACGAWLSGLRLLICDADVAVLAAEMQADVASSTSGSGLSSVRLPSTAHEADALWLLDTLEHARSGSHHTVLVLRDSAVAPGCRTASTANPSDSALAHLLSESNVRCVVDTQPAAATDSALPVSHAVSCLNRVSVHAIRVLGQGHQHFGESADAAVAPASAGDLASDPTGTAGGGANDESENSLSIRRATFPSTQPMSRLIQACQAHTMLSESMTVLPVPADTAGARAGDSDGVVSTDSEFAVPLPVAASGLKPKTCSDPFRLALHLLKVSRFDVDPCTIILPMRQVPVLQPRSTASTSTASPAAASTQSTGEGESSGDQRWVTDEVEVFSAAEIAAELSAMEGGTGTAGHASRSAAADS